MSVDAIREDSKHLALSRKRHWYAQYGFVLLAIGAFLCPWFFGYSCCTCPSSGPCDNLIISESGVTPYTFLALAVAVVLAALAIFIRYGWASAFSSGALALVAAFSMLNNVTTAEGSLGYSPVWVGIGVALIVISALLVILGGVVGILILYWRYPDRPPSSNERVGAYVFFGVGFIILWFLLWLADHHI
jgi:hypothetical protein